MKYLLIDTANTFFRARHVMHGSLDDKVGLAIHILLNSVKKVWQKFDADHCVFCFEGRSWRKDHYPPYKRNRQEAREALTPMEQEENEVFWETFDELKAFLKDKTNVTTLQNERLEADDLIAGFVQTHPNDEHVIISSDTDFYQLLSDKVSQYNGITEQHITTKGIFDDKDKPVIDKKTKAPKQIGDPKWLLFEKCIRGDSTDNVFSAYPRIRKNKLQEAFEDRHQQGFIWNNLMLAKWVDHEGIEHRVKDDYERNVELIDLSAQPEHIKEVIDKTIKDSVQSKERVSQVGIHMMKFCGKHDLKKIADFINDYVEPLNAGYDRI